MRIRSHVSRLTSHASRLTSHISRSHPALLSLLLILYFWAVGLTNLDRFPKIHEDESWQAAPGYTFWAEGRFGAELFAGFYSMEEHYYGFMPLFPIIVGAALHLFGLGLFQARLVPLILITLSLALTHRLGSKLFSAWHGLLTVAILATWRIAGPFAHLLSGIPLADAARIVRYDSAVPVFGLLALLMLVGRIEGWKNGRLEEWKVGRGVTPSFLQLSTSQYPMTNDPPGNLPISNLQSPITPFLTIGFLTGLATLSHVYGAFWLPALGLAMLWLGGRRALKAGLVMSFGFILTMTPWLIFVASGWQDFLNQSRNYSDRFGLLDPRFYLINLLLEVERYDPILNGAKQSFGAWLWLIACGLSLIWLLRWSLVTGHRSLMTDDWSLVTGHWSLVTSARLLIAPLVTLGGLFALLLSFKTFTYLATLWPLLAIVIAAGFVTVWRAGTRRWQRPLLAGLFIVAVAEGVLTSGRLQATARQTTPYQTFARTVGQHLPPDSRVMGLHHYWLGLAAAGRGYRSILAPIFWTNPKYVSQPVTFGQAAEVIPPDIILLDQIMLDFLAEAADPTADLYPLRWQIYGYLEARQAQRIGLLDDPTYGRMEIYQLSGKREDWKTERLE